MVRPPIGATERRLAASVAVSAGGGEVPARTALEMSFIQPTIVGSRRSSML
jgi:hypothetical protein